MEELVSLNDEQQMLLTRVLGDKYQVQATGYATPAQSPSPSQKGFQLGNEGLAIFVRDKRRKAFFITVIDFIEQVKVIDVRVTANLVYMESLQNRRCHTIKEESGGSVGVIFVDERKASLFYNAVTERIHYLKRNKYEISDDSSMTPQPQTKSEDPFQAAFTPQHNSPSLAAPPTSLAMNCGRDQDCWPQRQFQNSSQHNRPIDGVTPNSYTASTPPPPNPHLNTSTRSSDPSVRKKSINKRELLPPPMDSNEWNDVPSQVAPSKLFKTVRRVTTPTTQKIVQNGTSLSSSGTIRNASHNEASNGYVETHIQRPLISSKPKTNHITPSAEVNSNVHRTHKQTGNNVGQFRLPVFETGSNTAFSSSTPERPSLINMHSKNLPRPEQSRSISPQFQEAPNEAQNQSSITSKPSWPPLVSRIPNETKNRPQKASPTWSGADHSSQVSKKANNQSSRTFPPLPLTPASTNTTWKERRPPPTSPPTQFDLHSKLPPPPPPLIHNDFNLDSEAEAFPPPPPHVPLYSDVINRNSEQQSTPVQSVNPQASLLQGIISDNPLSRLRPVQAGQTGHSSQATSNSVRSGAGGGGEEGDDIMASLARRLKKIKTVVQDPIYMGEFESDNEEWDD